MGFYIKDLYIARVPKFNWHDKLTNPPTIPETSPIIRVAQLSPRLVAVAAGQNGGGAGLPDDDTVLPPSPLTPIVMPVGRLDLSDLQSVRENLVATLNAVDGQLAQMQPTAEDLDYVKSVVG